MSLKILIVDDNQPSAQTLGWMMEIAGYDFAIALSGKEAIATAQEFNPDVVFLDIGLPDMTGYELADELKKYLHDDTIYIAQTGWGGTDHIKRSKELGFAYHLLKPVDISLLPEMIEAADSKRKALSAA